MRFTTSITKVTQEGEIVRGISLTTLIQEKTFTETIFLILRNRLPTILETKMINAILVSMIDHGAGTNSTLTARITASAGNNLHSSVAAGILSLGGTRHGGALEGAAKFFQQNINTPNLPALLHTLKERKVRIPGFGHKILLHDYRTDTLFDIAKDTEFFGNHCMFAQKIEKELNKISSRPLPINMDGANAAILSDMGFDWRIVLGFFLIGRISGIIAHCNEEQQSEDGIQRLSPDEEVYLEKK